jgi:hypothetical protein
MSIEFDRRHAFYLDTNNQIRSSCAYRLDRLWRGEPDAAMPELANQRVRFAVLHIERFTSPPRVVVEYYPVLTFDAVGNLDLELQQQQLHAEVDRLESTNYVPAPPSTEPHESEAATWRPHAFTRRRLIAATTPTYRTRTTTGSQPSQAREPRPKLPTAVLLEVPLGGTSTAPRWPLRRRSSSCSWTPHRHLVDPHPPTPDGRHMGDAGLLHRACSVNGRGRHQRR